MKGLVIVQTALWMSLLRSFGCDIVKISTIGEGAKTLSKPATIVCQSNDTAVQSTELFFNEKTLKDASKEISQRETRYEIESVGFDDFGKYSCTANTTSGAAHNATLDFLFEVKAAVNLKPLHEVKAGDPVSMTCTITGYPIPPTIYWKFAHHYVMTSDKFNVTEIRTNLGHISSTLMIHSATAQMNGSYVCESPEGVNDTQLVVKSKPYVSLVMVKAVGKSKIYVSWKLVDGNSKINTFELKYFQGTTGERFVTSLDPKENSKLLKDLQPGENYFNFSITATNDIGTHSQHLDQNVTTLAEDPHFIPQIYVNGYTSDTVTLGWDLANAADLFNYYNVTVWRNYSTPKFYKARETPYMVEKLNPGANYTFKVQACSSYINSCDEFSPEVTGRTMEGISSAPQNLSVSCHETRVIASWDEPRDPHGHVMEYEVIITGNASYEDDYGQQKEDRIGPLSRTVPSNYERKAEFFNQPPNTQLYVSVCAKTRSRICGPYLEKSCTTPKTIPDSQALSKASWKRVQREEGKQVLFRVEIPTVSQRNGTICCFRIVVVRIQKGHSVHNLKPPADMDVTTYDAVHNGTNSGAYVAEVVGVNSRNLLIGDGVLTDHQTCRHKCWAQDEGIDGANYRPAEPYMSINSIDTRGQGHRKRHTSSNQIHSTNLPYITPHDGQLDAESYYTAYLDAIVINEKHQRIGVQSKYFPSLRPVRADLPESNIPGVAIVLGLILALIVVLIALMCVMRWRSKEPGEQEYGLSHSLQQWCRRLRGQQPIPNEEPPNLPPFSKDELVAAFIERHKDSDLGFQQEFEKLPDRFCDRTTHASDNQNNIGKNRYPDIKAYDQTRVKLSTSENGSSDYINANFVVGYKERKKFICAQGPMEGTVVDWWRMIWEQHIHFLLMLTNVEEYNKTKCAKYWPSEGSTNYADFTVTPMSEKRYSDYLVRTLKLTKSRMGNGNVEAGSNEEREIQQYHYLVWKDFMAPEHPVGILRFIKRFNESYAPDKGPILVHCSAGVGRSGTLVALDSMLQQLNEEGSVSIFNTICDLRHQRNYLVQSVKQYIFIYRALMEMAQFGDTDVSSSDLKAHVEKLKGIPDGKTISRMQEEFERLVLVIEDRKPFAVGASEENCNRNRHANVIPYDRNRVHLSPMPGINKEINTYINASFIEGYDSSEQYIIAQDPLENTIGDFWRMMVEQNIRTIVMLSEPGEEKCPRYWPEKDQETSHDYIKVKYMQSQSFPFYHRREFTVTDTKSDHSTLITQFQYNGWPVGDGEVPQIDRGVVELIDTTFKHKNSLEGSSGPIVVHCSDGADRSCIFVALAVLVQQMVNESRIDVFSVVRKLRSQRQGLFRNFAQYDLIYRGLVTYAELHVANGNTSH